MSRERAWNAKRQRSMDDHDLEGRRLMAIMLESKEAEVEPAAWRWRLPLPKKITPFNWVLVLEVSKIRSDTRAKIESLRALPLVQRRQVGADPPEFDEFPKYRQIPFEDLTPG